MEREKGDSVARKNKCFLEAGTRRRGVVEQTNGGMKIDGKREKKGAEARGGKNEGYFAGNLASKGQEGHTLRKKKEAGYGLHKGRTN